MRRQSATWEGCARQAVGRGEPGADSACYITANLASERHLARWKDWTPESVHDRREGITAWAKASWPHPGIPAEPTPEVIDELAEEADADDPTEL